MLNARPRFLPDESPISVLLRAAALNGWRGIQPMLAVCHPLPSKFRVAMNGRIRFYDYASRLGIELPDLKTFNSIRISGPTCRSVLQIGYRMPEWAFRVHGGAICPACLSQDSTPYLRAIWDVRIYRTCAVHGVLLIERCGVCKQQLDWKRRAPHICACGEDLRRSLLINGNIHVAEAIRTLIFATRQFVIDRVARVFRASVEALNIENDALAQEQVLIAIQNRGNELKDLLKKHIAISANHLHPRIILVPFMRENALAEIARKILREMNELSMTRNSETLITGTLSRREAIIALGISTDRTMDNLCSSGLLQAAPKFPNYSRQKEEISLASCDSLLRKLWRSNKSRSLDTRVRSPVMSLTEFMLHMIDSPQHCGGYDLDTGLSSLCIEGMKLQPIRLKSSQIERGNYWTLDIAAEVLGVKKYLVSSLVGGGWLKVIIDPRNPPAKLVCVHEAMKFGAQYVCAPKLAKDGNFSASAHFTQRLKAVGVVPVGGPNLDGTKVYIFRKSDIQALKITVRRKLGLSSLGELVDSTTENAGSAATSGLVSVLDAAELLSITLAQTRMLLNRGFLQKANVPLVGVMILESSINSFRKMLNDPDLVELDRVASSLAETKKQFIMRWITTGVVKLVNLGLRTCVHNDDVRRIREIKRRFILAPDCARTWKVGRFKIPNMEARGMIASTRMGDEGKVRLYLRADVEKLLGPAPMSEN